MCGGMCHGELELLCPPDLCWETADRGSLIGETVLKAGEFVWAVHGVFGLSIKPSRADRVEEASVFCGFADLKGHSRRRHNANPTTRITMASTPITIPAIPADDKPFDAALAGDVDLSSFDELEGDRNDALSSWSDDNTAARRFADGQVMLTQGFRVQHPIKGGSLAVQV